MRKIASILTVLFIVALGGSAIAQAMNANQQRLQRVKESTVKILINGNPNGTGFAVAANLVATNFHVVQQSSATTDGRTQITYSTNIEVQLYDGRRLTAIPHASVFGQGLQAAVGKDIVFLTIPVKDLKLLRLGHFSDVSEGDPVYLAGYPLGMQQVVVAMGMLSTKFKIDGYLGQGGQRDAAWLDITMNKGNSGGPVLLLGSDPSMDVVVGIANFILNPFAQSAEEVAKIAADFPGNVMMMGVDFKRFATLMGTALASQSYGISGCIAVDHLQLPKL